MPYCCDFNSISFPGNLSRCINMLDIKIPISAPALILPGYHSAAGAVIYKPGIVLVACCRAYRHPIRCPFSFAFGIDTLGIDIGIAAAIIFPYDNCAAGAVGYYLDILLVPCCRTNRDPLVVPTCFSRRIDQLGIDVIISRPVILPGKDSPAIAVYCDCRVMLASRCRADRGIDIWISI